MTKKTAEDFLPRGVGKPTLYDERYCEEVLEYFTVEPYRFNIKRRYD